jgi:hypothetical protein
MKRKHSNPMKQNFTYPKETAGSRQARELRSECNSLSKSERKHLFQDGLRRINQGAPKK